MRGLGKQLETSRGGRIEKQSGNESQLCMNQVLPAICYTLHCDVIESQAMLEQPKVAELLAAFKK